jgi:hypothetical protein
LALLTSQDAWAEGAAGRGSNEWLANSYGTLWTVFYALVSALAVLLVWEMVFLLQKQKERGGGGVRSDTKVIPPEPAPVEQEDPFKTMLKARESSQQSRASAASPSMTPFNERSMYQMRTDPLAAITGEEQSPEPAAARPQEAAPSPRDPAPPTAEPLSTPSPLSDVVNSNEGGSRRFVRLNMPGGDEAAPPGASSKADGDFATEFDTPLKRATPPASRDKGADSWTDLLKKTTQDAPPAEPRPRIEPGLARPAPPAAPPLVAPAGGGDAADPWKRLLREARDDHPAPAEPAAASPSARLPLERDDDAPTAAAAAAAFSLLEPPRPSSEPPPAPAPPPPPPRLAPPIAARPEPSLNEPLTPAPLPQPPPPAASAEPPAASAEPQPLVSSSTMTPSAEGLGAREIVRDMARPEALPAAAMLARAGQLRLPGGGTRDSWQAALRLLRAATVSSCTFTRRVAQPEANLETAGTSSPTTPKKGRKRTLAGGSLETSGSSRDNSKDSPDVVAMREALKRAAAEEAAEKAAVEQRPVEDSPPPPLTPEKPPERRTPLPLAPLKQAARAAEELASPDGEPPSRIRRIRPPKKLSLDGAEESEAAPRSEPRGANRTLSLPGKGSDAPDAGQEKENNTPLRNAESGRILEISRQRKEDDPSNEP